MVKGWFGKVFKNTYKFSNAAKHFSDKNYQTDLQMWPPPLTYFSKQILEHFSKKKKKYNTQNTLQKINYKTLF